MNPQIKASNVETLKSTFQTRGINTVDHLKAELIKAKAVAEKKNQADKARKIEALTQEIEKLHTDVRTQLDALKNDYEKLHSFAESLVDKDKHHEILEVLKDDTLKEEVTFSDALDKVKKQDFSGAFQDVVQVGLRKAKENPEIAVIASTVVVAGVIGLGLKTFLGWMTGSAVGNGIPSLFGIAGGLFAGLSLGKYIGLEKLKDLPWIGGFFDKERRAENSKESKYLLGIKALLGLGRNSNESILNVLALSNVKQKTFSQLKEIHVLGETGISDKLGITYQDKARSDKEVFGALNVLVGKEDTIQEVFKNKNPNWKTQLTLEQIFTETIKFSSVLSGIKKFNPEEVFFGAKEVGELDLSGKESDLHQIYEDSKETSLKGVSDKLLIRISADNTIGNDAETEARLKQDFKENPKDGEFITQLFAFRRSFIANISSFYVGPKEHKGEFIKFFTDHPLSPREALEYFIISGGNLEYNKYDSLTRSLIFLKIWNRMGKKGEYALRGKTYDRVILGLTSNSDSIIGDIPEPFKNEISDLLKRYYDKISETFTGLLSEVWNALSESQRTILILSGAAIFAVLFRVRVFRARAGGLASGIGIASIAFFAASMSQSFSNPGNDEFRASLKRKGIHSEDDLKREIERVVRLELSKKGVKIDE